MDTLQLSEGEQRYAAWEQEVDRLTDYLIERDNLLRQYAVWLETSEQTPTYHGKDIWDMLMGVLQGASDINFIPGVGDRNLVAVVGQVQERTGLDLGVCPNLESKAREQARAEHTGDYSTPANDSCNLTGDDVIVISYKNCTPPQRSQCELRRRFVDVINPCLDYRPRERINLLGLEENPQ